MSMYKYVRADYISCMSRVGNSEKPPFMVGVYESGAYIGEPYLKIYSHFDYPKAEYVTRLSMRDGHRIVHKNRDRKKEWKDIDNRTLKALEVFLDKPSRNIKGYTNWQVLMYLWNYETSIISNAPEDLYDTNIEAFIDGYYDTEENLKNPNYIASYSVRPGFQK